MSKRPDFLYAYRYQKGGPFWSPEFKHDTDPRFEGQTCNSSIAGAVEVNLGVKHFMCFDIDEHAGNPSGKKNFASFLFDEGVELQPTWVTNTKNNGMHVWYALPAGLYVKDGPLPGYPSVEVKGIRIRSPYDTGYTFNDNGLDAPVPLPEPLVKHFQEQNRLAEQKKAEAKAKREAHGPCDVEPLIHQYNEEMDGDMPTKCPAGHGDRFGRLSEGRWFCKGASHPDGFGLRARDGTYTGDMLDVFCFEYDGDNYAENPAKSRITMVKEWADENDVEWGEEDAKPVSSINTQMMADAEKWVQEVTALPEPVLPAAATPASPESSSSTQDHVWVCAPIAKEKDGKPVPIDLRVWVAHDLAYNGVTFVGGKHFQHGKPVSKEYVDNNILVDNSWVFRASTKAAQASLDLWRAARHKVSTTLPFLTADDFLALPDEPDPWLLPDLVPAGAVWALGGASNSGKSWLALGMFVKPLIEKDTPVGYVTPESSRTGFKKRLRALGIKGKNLHVLHQQTLTLGGSNKDQAAADQEALIATVKKLGLKVLILDPLSNFLADSVENDAGDMAQVRDRLIAIVAATGVSIGILAHTAKGKWDKDGGEDPALSWFRGSGVSAASFDMAFIVTFNPDDIVTSPAGEWLPHGFRTVKVKDDAQWLNEVVTLDRVLEHPSRKLLSVTLKRETVTAEQKARAMEAKAEKRMKAGIDLLVANVMTAGGTKVAWQVAKDGLPKNGPYGASAVLAEAIKQEKLTEEGGNGNKKFISLAFGPLKAVS